MDTVMVEYVGPVQTLSASALPEHRERVAALLPLCHYGPSYVRGVAEDLGRYRWAVIKGESESASYWLESAESVRDYYAPSV